MRQKLNLWLWVITLIAVGNLGVSLATAKTSPSTVLRRTDNALGSQMVDLASKFAGNSVNPGEDKTLSPYLYVADGNPDTERLPLKETSAQVQIAGVIAKVKVKQVFENTGSKPIEAIYVFPASTRAAVHGMRMKIGERTIIAKIDKKAQARQQYETAKSKGKRASLLEQERPNVFTMNVANIMPRDRIEVELDYSELLIPENATYEFVYPTVVGPRYGGGTNPKKDRWIANPYLSEGAKEPYRFDIAVHLETGIALKELSSPSHKLAVNYLSKSSANVRLQESGGGNRDFVLHYKLAGNKIETGLLLWKDKKESFFLAMLEPPIRPDNSQIPPREYIFLLDVSGSMHGFPLNTAKVLAKNLLSQLRPTDMFNIAMFSGGSYVMSPQGSVPATAANIRHAEQIISKQTGGGGTELMGGLTTAYSIPKKVPGLSRSVVVVTDGYVGVEAQAFKFIREHLSEANLFAFGIGSSVNRGLIEAMARAGQGEPFIVLDPSKATAQAQKLQTYIQYPVLSNISVKFTNFDAREVAPYHLPDLMASRPLVLFGKFQGEPHGKIQIAGYSGKGKYITSLKVNPKALKEENKPIRWLWARKWVSLLDDQYHLTAAKEVEEAITDLGLTYTLLTSFTSFVAIDSKIANKTGTLGKVNQPLPLPKGVSNMAVSASSPAGFAKSAQPLRRFQSTPRPTPTMPAMAPAERAAAPRSGKRYKTEKMKSRLDSDKELREEKDSSAKLRVANKWKVVITKSWQVTNTKFVLEAIKKQLNLVSNCPALGSITIKLSIDKNGKVIKIQFINKKTNQAIAACVQPKLIGLVSKTVATKAETGLVELTVTAIAK